MIKLAWLNLINEKTRLFISVFGIALAMVLILVIAGIFAGSEEFAVAYIKNEPAPIWLMQAGVSNMHMASSFLPPETARLTQEISGVSAASGVLYAGANLKVDDVEILSYIIGFDPDAALGGPWQVVEGQRNIKQDEVIVDVILADRYGLELGDTVSILGQDLTIAGFSQGTFGIASSIAFVNKETLADLIRVAPDSASYVLVRPEEGTDVDGLTGDLQRQIPGVNVMTQTEFAESDREMIRQMGADIIRAMDIIAYVVGLLVIGLTIYIATLERSREYGMLKAIGARPIYLISVVIIQAYISAILGIGAGVGLAYLIAALIGRLAPDILVLIQADMVARQIPMLIIVTALASLMPIGRLTRMDPMIVFKG